MRDALMHFEDWSRGMGRGPQQDERRTGARPRDIARLYWGFGYNPTTGTISPGPYAIHVDTAARVASDLARAIYLAAHQVDRTATAAVRAAVVRALDHAGLPHGSPEDVILVSPGHDLRIWISLRISAESDLVACRELAAHVQTALSVEELHLVSAAEPHAHDVVDRLARGEPLAAVETGPDNAGPAVPE